MANNGCNKYEVVYFTTPFCGVCQSAKPLIRLLAMSLEVPLLEEHIHRQKPAYRGLVLSMTPAVALVHGVDVVYYTEDINNLSDLFNRFERARIDAERGSVEC
jgi:thiol-disulfide isomerase/thioredoxin